ncbi:MAG: FecR domain-containing protein [Spirochaetes bacterium]|nr:FecR domain-containing protein [Spirochaetota bacterium]
MTKTILIGYIQKTLNERKVMAVRNHLETCDSCRKNLAIFAKALSPSGEKKIKPARSVLAGVLDYYDNYDSSRAVPAPVPRKLQLRYAVIALGAACACVLIFALHTRLQYESAPIYASKVKGTVRADTHILRKGQEVRPGVLLTTGDDSKLAIMYGKIMKLIAGPQSRISITKSHIDKKSGKIYIEMVIDKGSIFAETVKGWKLQYTLITPHGKVSSAGSRLAMRVEPQKTRVMVKDGSASISSNRGHSIDSEEGSGYSITDKEVTSAMDSTDDEADENGTLYDETVRDLLGDDSDDGDSIIQ